ncbi:hypothetical protein [Heyndrickxia camelliae]|uniref:Uncharacterized protein n=1 Tax=Heyndrickxia camelliae TaxID=1707093 RepID=A0A2N3LG77_9BACI|nr:hypothetical protein [Heyndrickxia camelliae]PKR83564.1 hypothetical protein CWO92_18540 [Heyndrickxia camelliae]
MRYDQKIKDSITLVNLKLQREYNLQDRVPFYEQEYKDSLQRETELLHEKKRLLEEYQGVLEDKEAIKRVMKR